MMRTLSQAGPILVTQLKKFAGMEYAKGTISLEELGNFNANLNEALIVIEKSAQSPQSIAVKTKTKP